MNGNTARILKTILSGGPNTQPKLAEHLGINQSTVSRRITELRRQDYLEPVPGAGSNGFQAVGGREAVIRRVVEELTEEAKEWLALHGDK